MSRDFRTEQPWIRLITTEAILMEYGNMLSQKSVRQKAFNYIRILQNSAETEIIPANSELFEKSLYDFGRYKDKEWGLVDCMSFVIMREKNILYALTSDEHFEQAGFVMLLKSV